MFVETLGDVEREALLELLAYLTLVNGEIHEEQVAFIVATASRFGLGETAEGVFKTVAGKDLRALCDRFKRPKAKAIVLVELINIGLVDGHYDEAERKGVRAVSVAMGAEEGLVEHLEAWVERGHEWQREGQQLMGLNLE